MTEQSLRGKAILLVHAGSESKEFILKKMKELGLYIVCLNRNHPAWAEKYIDNWIIGDLNDSAQCVEQIKIFLKTHPKIKLEGALTFWEEAVLLTSKITERFNWVGIPYAHAKKAKNKYLFREFCAQNGLPTPQYKLFTGNKNITEIEKYLNYPLVIKPVYGAASFFVIKVKNRKELLETYEYIKSRIESNWLAQEWKNLELLVEEYIDGDEVDIDILLQNGKMKFCSIADNYRTKEPYFVETTRALPSSLPEGDQVRLAKTAEEILERLGIRDGCIHFEAKMTKNGPMPLEINLRMGGDEIYTSTQVVWGVDLIENAVKVALGIYIKPEKPAGPKKYTLSQALHTDRSGMLANLTIDSEINKKEFVDEFFFGKKIGDPIMVPPDGYEYLGWISVSGDNLLDAQDNLKEALSYIRYQVAEFDEESYLGKIARKDRSIITDFKKNQLIQAAKIERVRRVEKGEQQRLHVGIVGNTVTSEGRQGSALLIQKELESRGYKTTFFDLSFLFGALSKMYYEEVDIIFNASEELEGNAVLQPQVAALLEALQVPYTGPSSLALGLCQDKIKTKKFFSHHAIPTPRWDYAYLPEHTIDAELRYPLIIKSGTREGEPFVEGVVVKNKEQLKKHQDILITKAQQPALVEEYVEGQEYEVVILGNTPQNTRVLPLIKYSSKNRNPKLITSEKESLMQQKISAECPPRKLDQKLEALITEIALDSYYIMRCRDYGTVRVRVDREGNPYVIRVEANPTLTLGSSVVRAAKAMKYTFGDLVEEILQVAIERYKQQPSVLN